MPSCHVALMRNLALTAIACARLRFHVVLPHQATQIKVGSATRGSMQKEKLDLLQGTLDVMVLRTLTAMGSLHGYGIARRIEQVSGHEFLLNQGTIYASLVRLQQRGWIAARRGTSDNNRKAKFYSITKAGQRQLVKDTAHWQRLAGVMGRVIAMESDGGER
jgi:PadR family transcriptional regulator, regulatory protein PadR